MLDKTNKNIKKETISYALYNIHKSDILNYEKNTLLNLDEYKVSK